MKYYGKALLALLALGVLALAACQSTGKTETAVAGADAESDTCGASQYQRYIGKPLSAVSSLHFDTPVRAIPWNSAVTMDFICAGLISWQTRATPSAKFTVADAS